MIDESEFHDVDARGTRQSARQVPTVMNDWLRPNSRLDGGSGTGVWRPESR